MNRDGLEQLLKEAHEIVERESDRSHSWPIALLRAIGAWLGTLPVLALLAVLLFRSQSGSAEFGLFGAVIGLVSIVVLNARPDSQLAGQAAFPFLIAGIGLLTVSLLDNASQRSGALVMATIAFCAGLATPHPWQRTALGATAAALLMLYITPLFSLHIFRSDEMWLLLHVQVAIWIAGREFARVPSAGSRLLPVLNGWLFATLIGLVYWSGPAFLTPGSLYVDDNYLRLERNALYIQGVSLACSIAAAVTAARALPALRQPWCFGVMATLIAFTCIVPALGALLLALACCIADRRSGLACTVALAAAWAVGSAYYDLGLPLYQKALLFSAAGAAVIALCARSLRALQQPIAMPARAGHVRLGRIYLCIAGLASIVIANAAIVRNELLIMHSEVAYIEIGPADPRSMMQGDFMRLNFRLPLVQPENSPFAGGGLAQIVAIRSKNGVATLDRWYDGEQKLAGNEFLIDLTMKNGRWMLGTDAWFFREGEAARFEKARYGEFRIAPSGRVLLVGMRGPALEPL